MLQHNSSLGTLSPREAVSRLLRAQFENHLRTPCNKENLLQKLQFTPQV